MEDALFWCKTDRGMLSVSLDLIDNDDDNILNKSMIHSLTEEEYMNINANFDDIMIIYRDSDLENTDIKDEICNIGNNFCVLFSTDKIIQEILESYLKYSTENIDEIINTQLKLDFYRMDIYLDYQKIPSLNDFLKFISPYQKYKHNVMPNLRDLLMILTTQSSFYYPFQMVYNVYYKENTKIYIIQDSDSPYINIVLNKNTIDIVFKKTFRYVNISTDEVLHKFYTFMVLTIDLFEGSVGYFYSTENFFCQNGGYEPYPPFCETQIGVIYWFVNKDLGITAI